MDIKLPNVSKVSVANGAGFHELYQGIDTYSAVRSGETVKIVTADGEVEGKVSGIVIGPLGQFLGQGMPHVSNVGRGYDVRTVVDALEERYPASKKGNEKALDPRTIYTQVQISVPYTPVMTPAPAVVAA